MNVTFDMVVGKLKAELANKIVDIAILETQIEVLKEELAKLNQHHAESSDHVHADEDESL